MEALSAELQRSPVTSLQTIFYSAIKPR